MNDVRANCPTLDLTTISQLREERFDVIGFGAGEGLRDASIPCEMIEVPERRGPQAEVLIPGET